MQRFCILAVAAVFACGAHGQSTRPQLTWQGDVDRSCLIVIRGKHIEVQPRQGASNAATRFNAALPDRTVAVRLEVLEGRGWVRIAEQPRAANDFSAVIAIDDSQQGASHYSLALYWPIDDRIAKMDRLKWSGRVTGAAVIACRARTCAAESSLSATVVKPQFRFSAPLPPHDNTVQLSVSMGTARVLENPSAANSYTVRIAAGGAPVPEDVEFTLSWERQ